MKKSLSIASACLMLISVLGVKSAHALDVPTTTYGPAMYDDSGKVITQVFRTEPISTNSHGHFADINIVVDSNYVVVGGGVMTDGQGSGQFVVSSRPTEDDDPRRLQYWFLDMKDHYHPDKSQIRGYAIGLRIQGVSASTLRNLITVYKTNEEQHFDGNLNYPQAEVDIPGGHVLLGGGMGAEDWGPGQTGMLAMNSEPAFNADGWYAAAKEHGYAYPMEIHAYAIGMPSQIAGVGELKSSRQISQPLMTGRVSSSIVLETNGHAVTSCGAGTTWKKTSGNAGQFITDIVPRPYLNRGGCQAKYKDIVWADTTTQSGAFLLGLKVKLRDGQGTGSSGSSGGSGSSGSGSSGGSGSGGSSGGSSGGLGPIGGGGSGGPMW